MSFLSCSSRNSSKFVSHLSRLAQLSFQPFSSAAAASWDNFILPADQIEERKEASRLATSSNAVSLAFDRSLKVAHRSRAARIMDPKDMLYKELASRLLDRLNDCTHEFPTLVILGGAGEFLLDDLPTSRAKVQRLIFIESSPEMLERARGKFASLKAGRPDLPWPTEALFLQGDEEALPLRDRSVDCIVSCLGLHWVNDLPGALTQCQRALKPDGLLLACLLGGDTMHELRAACSVAEMEREGGVSQRTSPMVQVRDAGSLLGRAAFALPTVDVDDLLINYPSPVDLVTHLRSLGEMNASSHRRPFLSRNTALAAGAVYQGLFPAAEGEGVSVTFQVIFMASWSPAKTQQRAKTRGSATVSLHDLNEALKEKGVVSGSLADEEEKEK